MTQPLQTNPSVTSIDIKAMEVELNEYRHRFEQKVEQRTAQLVRRITLLESCNSTLCDKLELVQRELTALKQQPAAPVTRPYPITQSMPVTQTTPVAGRTRNVLSVIEGRSVHSQREERC